MTDDVDGLAARRSQTTRLAVLFGLIYFIQGIGEPTTGLIAQPVRSMLASWGKNAEEIAYFMLIVGFPWYIKPLFGIMTDFIPLFGMRRKSYLLIATLLAALGLIFAGMWDFGDSADADGSTVLMLLLLLPCIGVAFTDVVADALMVEKGQPLNYTGRLQSIQWASLYTAGILTGVIGGWLSQNNLQQRGFVICGSLTFVTFLAAWFMVDEPADAKVDLQAAKKTLRTTWKTIRHGFVLPVAAFLFLLNFNPFSGDVQYVHMTQALGLSEQVYGNTQSVNSVTAIVACMVYGVLAPRLRIRTLIHLSLVTMVLSSLGFWGLHDETSAYIIAGVVGFFYMITLLVQLDMAARYCPPESAGTVFALLMSLTNFSYSLSNTVGGNWYTAWGTDWGAERAFDVLVGVGALFTAACWLLLFILPKDTDMTPSETMEFEAKQASEEE